MKKRFFGGIALAVSLVSLVACGNGTTAGTGGGDDDDDTKSDGGGGGSEGGTSSSVAQFVGQWTNNGGTGTLACPNEPTQTLSGSGVLTIAAGSTPGTVTTSSTANGSNCVTVFTVSGNAATANPGQTCTLTSSDNGETITEMRSGDGMFSVVNNTLTSNISSTDIVNEGGETFDCTITGTLIYTKVGS